MNEAVANVLVGQADAIRARLQALIRLPSVSTDPAYEPGMQATRDYLLGWFREIGLAEVQPLDGGGHPAVYGSWSGAPGKPTLLIYGHYDVQPPDPVDEWVSPPFEPTERDGCLFGRGASDDKGSSVIAIAAVAAFLQQTGACPVNVKLFLEGEEEVGSPSLPAIVARYGALLQADAMLSADGGRASRTIPTINVGARGNTGFEIKLTTAAKDLHSGKYGGAVRNALHEMAKLVATLHDREGRIAVSGYLDSVAPPTNQARHDTAAFPVDEEAFCAEVGAAPLGEPGYTVRERLTLRPSIDVNGMWGGYIGAGAKTVIPREARAKLTMRLVAGQDPARIVGIFRDWVAANTPADLHTEIALFGEAPGFEVAPDNPFLGVAREVLGAEYGRPAVLVGSGGSIPVVESLRRILGLDSLLLGFGLDDDQVHSPNEKFDLRCLDHGTNAHARLLAAVAAR